MLFPFSPSVEDRNPYRYYFNCLEQKIWIKTALIMTTIPVQIELYFNK